MTEYLGHELDIFAEAVNWKRYWSSLIRRYVRGDVLEVGAGIGSNTPYLKGPTVRSWTCLEPDPSLGVRMRAVFAGDPGLRPCHIKIGNTEAINATAEFDSIIYIDVLEHILDDRSELQRASTLLRTGGNLIVLSPAYAWLYTSFDRNIGHCRRYRKSVLKGLAPKDCRLDRALYLDSAGFWASAGNRLFLKQAMPTLRQIHFWDSYLVPISRLMDRLVLHSFGKSILAIWTKP